MNNTNILENVESVATDRSMPTSSAKEKTDHHRQRISEIERLELNGAEPEFINRIFKRLDLAKRYLRSGEFGACGYELEIVEQLTHRYE